MIQCTRFKKMENGALIGFADIYFDKCDLEIFSCPVYTKDGILSIAMPAKEFKDAQGLSKFSSILRFRTPGAFKEFSSQAVEAIKNKIIEDENMPKNEFTF